MQFAHMTGRVAAAPVKQGTVVKVVLMSDEYAGKDKESGESKTRTLRLQFKAFGKTGDRIMDNVMVGDQLNIYFRITNNDWTDDAGNDKFDYDFLVDEFTFGAPGPKKREELARRTG